MKPVLYPLSYSRYSTDTVSTLFAEHDHVNARADRSCRQPTPAETFVKKVQNKKPRRLRVGGAECNELFVCSSYPARPREPMTFHRKPLFSDPQ
jgi:hypothetical protein